jgi:hypothetical protein
MANPTDTDIKYLNRYMGKAAAEASLGDVANIRVYQSAASAGGAASEQLAVTDLASSDQVLSVYQSVAGANSTAYLYLIQLTSPLGNSIISSILANVSSGCHNHNTISIVPVGIGYNDIVLVG